MHAIIVFLDADDGLGCYLASECFEGGLGKVDQILGWSVSLGCRGKLRELKILIIL